MASRLDLRSTRGFAAPFRCALAGVLGVALGVPVAAQDGISRPVIQAVPPPALDDLNAALGDLARDPRDVSALLRAGWASLGLDDPNAALGYFRRAEAVAPSDGAVKAGLASTLVRLDDPVTAVRLFDEAEASGTPMAEYAADRGLAHDLVGDNVRAQQYYRQALAREDDPETVRRLALSQAISGDKRGSEATLLPLLQRRDLAAYRARAFALAILGESEEAVSIAETMLPERLSNGLAPYLRYMPRLTRAQQAAAANLGQFPRASEIGRDEPRIAAFPSASAPQVAAREPGSRLVPAGEPLGSANSPGATSRDRRPAGESDPREDVAVESDGGVASVTYEPLPQARPPATGSSASPAAAPASAPAPAPAQTEPVVVARADTPTSAAPPAEPPRPSLSITNPAPDRPASVDEDVSLGEAFAAFADLPEAAAGPAPGAVDVTAIEPPRERPQAEEPEPPAHPSRHWVQVATGSDIKALAFDWRRIKREAGELLEGRDGFTAAWGQTSRLVTGPYGSAAEAQDVVNALQAEGLDSFPFTSADGEEVAPME